MICEDASQRPQVGSKYLSSERAICVPVSRHCFSAGRLLHSKK